MPILLCEKCNVYYEIDSKDEIADLKICECGNSLVYYDSVDEYLKNEVDISDVNLLIKHINTYESAVSKIIIYCVAESSSTLSISKIIQVLKGSKSILNYKLDGLNSYATLTNFSRKRIKRYINTLIDQKYLKMKSISPYDPVSLTRRGLEFLLGDDNLKVSIYGKKNEKYPEI